jgi:hypothetical protein
VLEGVKEALAVAGSQARTTVVAVVVLALCAFDPSPVLADTLVTTQGKEWHGTVTEKDDGYVLALPAGGSITFPRDKVREVRRGLTEQAAPQEGGRPKVIRLVLREMYMTAPGGTLRGPISAYVNDLCELYGWRLEEPGERAAVIGVLTLDIKGWKEKGATSYFGTRGGSLFTRGSTYYALVCSITLRLGTARVESTFGDLRSWAKAKKPSMREYAKSQQALAQRLAEEARAIQNLPSEQGMGRGPRRGTPFTREGAARRYEKELQELAEPPVYMKKMEREYLPYRLFLMLAEARGVKPMDAVLDAAVRLRGRTREEVVTGFVTYGPLRPAGAVPALMQGLEDERHQYRPAAAELLGRIRHVDEVWQSPVVYRALTQMAEQDEDKGCRKAARKALKSMDKEGRERFGDLWVLLGPESFAPLPGLEQKLCSEYDGARRLAGKELVRIARSSPQDAMRHIAPALAHQSAEVRRDAVEVLGGMHPAIALPALLEAVQDEDESVRATARKEVLDVREPTLGASCVPVLFRSLQHDSPAVRRVATEALAGINDPRAVQGLRRAVKDEDEQVRQHAEEGLRARGLMR